MYNVLAGCIGLFIGWVITLLYSKEKLGQFPFYDRIIAYMYADNSSIDSLKGTEKFLTDLREAVVNQILNNQPQLFDAIAKQRIILSNQKRDPVAIFLNIDTFKALLYTILNADKGDKVDRTDKKILNEVDSLYDAMQGLDMPVGHLGVLPIYVTELLVEAPVFVAGGIRWKI